MLENTLHKIEELLQATPELSEAKRVELLSQVHQLKQELSQLSPEDQTKVLGAVKTNKIEEFELSHPRLYELAKSLSVGLNGLGV